jgi:Leu/Phe-tRNA-protein transferase
MKPVTGVASKYNAIEEKEDYVANKDYVQHEFNLIKHQHKLEKIDAKIRREEVFHIKQKDRKIIPTNKLPFTKVVNKAKPVFDSEWDEKNKALIKACVEERKQEGYKQSINNKNALKLVKEK